MTRFAFIFDMDGVIIDNYRFHLQAWMQFCRNYGIQITEEVFKTTLFGRNNRYHLQYLFGSELGVKEMSDYAAEKESIYRKLYEPFIELTPGLGRFLELSFALGIPMAVATSAPIENIDFVFDHTGIRHYFKAVIDPSGVKNGKPAPDIFLKAAENIGVLPVDCIVFEDSLSGIKAGLDAGMRVVGVATTHKAGELREAHLIINGFAGLLPGAIVFQ